MKYFLSSVLLLSCISIAFASSSQEEDVLLTKFSEALKTRNLAKKCQATQDLFAFYNKKGDKGKADMANGILKRDCKKS